MVTTLHKYRTLAREAFLPDTSNKLDCIAFIILFVFVVTAPVLYGVTPAADRHAMGGGTVGPAGNMFLELFAFLLAAVTFWSRPRVRPPAIPLCAVLALALLGLFQLLPLPEELLEKAAPVNLKIYHESAEILSLFGKKASPAPRISIAPTETFGSVLIILAYVAFFLSAASLLRNRLRRRLLVTALMGTAAIQILVGVAFQSREDRLHGVFVNADHFAAYLEIALALAFGALWSEVLTSSDRAQGAVDRGERFERRFVPFVARTLLWGVIAAGVGLTRSRGGILSAAMTTLVLLAMAVSHRRVRFPWRAAAGMSAAVLAGALFVAATAGANPFLRFLERDPRDLGGDLRVTLWKTSLQAWREFPLLGSGLGTFREAFRRVQPRDLSGLIEQAHSDSLQLLVTGGVIGAALGVLAVGSLFVVLARAWRRQKHREESAFVLAGFGALLSLTLHGLVDFNLSIPPIPATLACALGGAWAAARRN